MLQSLLALPVVAAAELVLFLMLYLMTPLNGKQAAVIVAAIAFTGVLLYSLLEWPGADVLAMYIAVLAVTAYILGIISHAREAQQPETQKRRRWFHWGPAVIVIFFIALFALDGVLVVVSRQGLPEPVAELMLPKAGRQNNVRSVFPGTVANDFQKKESLYNEYLEQVQRQEQRGWQIRKGWVQQARAGIPATFQVQVLEADGAPVQFAQVGGVFQRPSDSRLDQHFTLRETEPGVYRAEIMLKNPGVWNLMLRIHRGEQLHEVRASTSVLAADE